MDFKTGSKKGTRFLQIENEGNKPDDKFIYLPELKSSRRVNSSEGSKSFLGTDATYDDLSTRDVDEDEHTYLIQNQASMHGALLGLTKKLCTLSTQKCTTRTILL